MKKYTYIIAAFLCMALVSSCGNSRMDFHGNTDGGATRENNYESCGTFYCYKLFPYQFATTDVSGAQIPPLVVCDTMIAFATERASIVAIGKLYETNWEIRLDTAAFPIGKMCSDDNNNIYVVLSNGYLYSVSPIGKLNWKYKLCDPSPMTLFGNLLKTEDGIVVGNTDGLLQKVSFAGSNVWTLSLGKEISESFPADEKGNLYVGYTCNDFSQSDTIAKVSPAGQILQKWATDGLRLLSGAILSEDRLFVCGSQLDAQREKRSFVASYSTDGRQLWRSSIDVMPKFVSADSKQNVYCVGVSTTTANPLSGVFSFDKDGKENWKLYLEMTAHSPLYISKKKLALVASKGGVAGLYTVKRDGTLGNTVTLTSGDALLLSPQVDVDGSFVFGGSEKLFMAKVDDTFLNKLLPW